MQADVSGASPLQGAESSGGELLGWDGPFARELPGFSPRTYQQAMAVAVEQAIAAGDSLVVEAGTGTGKTFAYLVPALLSGRRVIVSTGTKALQDQLFHRDLPRVISVLGTRVATALLKGRANYLCLHRFEQARRAGDANGVAASEELAAVHAWARRTRSGDKAELADVPEDSPLWPRVTSTVENCVGAECPFHAECFVVRARRAAQEAELLVVNHHLLFADLAIKQEGFGEILPGAEAFILDEAHQVPELAGQFFSVSLSARQLRELGRDALAEAAALSGAGALLVEPVAALDQAIRCLRLALDAYPDKGPFALIERDEAAIRGLTALDDALAGLVAVLERQAGRSRGLASVAERAELQLERLRRLSDGAAADAVLWYELSPQGFAFHATPLDLSHSLRTLREASGAAWVFTSATLSAAGDFTHFTRQLGLDDPRTLHLESPFDYASQGLAWLPGGLPAPSSPEYTERMVDAVLPLLEASAGGAFLLFTSHRALRRAAERLASCAEFPLFVQGSAPRHQLLEGFRAAGNGVLLGAASFWEGVDVPGDALRVVVIDKLPFAAPDDPVLAARLESIRAGGEPPFTAWQLPAAIIALKQGAGRLIRDVHDRGVLVLCDPRLTTRGYGKAFLSSLPPFRLTRDAAEARAFLAARTRGQAPPPEACAADACSA
ncbi:MAG: ATP-dependent DNA helicase [Xanthomonadales bacterium]|nr:ATP-dependent DNA helicase [Xanthomonadales bacterium]